MCNMNLKREIFDQRMCMQLTCACTFCAELGNEKQQQQLQQQKKKKETHSKMIIIFSTEQKKTQKIKK